MNTRFFSFVVAGLIVFGLAVTYRFADITHYPPGLFPDQAANGEDAFLILNGDARPFYPRGNGREAVFFYLQAGLMKTFGVKVWPMFAASAIVGTLTVVAVYFATAVYFGRLAGILAMLFMATSYWHVTISRTGFRAILIPLFVALFTAFVGYVVRSVHDKKTVRSYIYAMLAGAAFAGGFYTYIAYRVMIGVVLGVLFFLLLAALHPAIGFPHVRRYGKQALVGLLTALLVFAPLGYYFVQHPDTFIGRAGQVSIFSHALQQQYGGGTLLGTLLYSLRTTLISFFAGDGDLNWRHSVPGHPLLNPLVATMFLLGLAWTIRGLWQVGVSIVKGKEIHLGMVYPYLLLVLSGMLVPVITTAEGMPHGLRSVGLMVPVFMLAGVAASVCIHWVEVSLKGSWRGAVAGVAAGLLILSTLYDGGLYFLVARNDSKAYYEYRGDLTVVSDYINSYRTANPNSPRPYLVLDEFSVQTVHFLTGKQENAHDHIGHPDEAQHKYKLLDPATSHLTPIGASDIIIFTQSTLPDADRYAQKYGDSIQLLESVTNRFGQEIMRVYRSAGPLTKESNLDA